MVSPVRRRRWRAEEDRRTSLGAADHRCAAAKAVVATAHGARERVRQGRRAHAEHDLEILFFPIAPSRGQVVASKIWTRAGTDSGIRRGVTATSR